MAKIFFSDIKSGIPLDQLGNIALVTNDLSVRQSIMAILSTRKGERVMQPTFGSDLHTFLFDPIDIITERLMKQEILTALSTWEDRIDITRISVKGDEDSNSYVIGIGYFISKTRQEGFFEGRVKAAENV